MDRATAPPARPRRAASADLRAWWSAHGAPVRVASIGVAGRTERRAARCGGMAPLPLAADSPTATAADLRRDAIHGVLYMLGAALGFSIMSLLVKVASATFPTMQIVFLRSAFMAALTYAVLRHDGVPATGNDRRTLALRGAVGATALSLFYLGIGRLPLGDAVTIQYTAPVWTALTAALLIGERLRGRVLAGAALSMLGVMLVARPSFLFGAGVALDGWGAAAVATAAVLSGLAYTFVRKLRATDRPMTIIFYLSWIGAVGSLPFALTGAWVWPTGWEWPLLLAIGLATHAGQVGLTKGMARLEAGTAASIGYLQVVLAFAWGALFLGDAVDGWSLAGAALVVSSVLLVVRRAKAR
ncbi:MAG: EamA family transporter [Rhodothermaceae bacterium]|nr:EamA family transporter [Rhodothermaceae bacterium]MAQ95213.1 EamA family transporter [Rhodothermaceae bacterium]MBC14573.1 EamA family transporter [Rhodothermaceae bacterium]